MSKFEETKWADSRFSRSYRDDADIYIPFRYQCLEITKSLYRHFISQNDKARILDLGCGDGELLCFLKEKKHVSGTGIERNEEKMAGCIEKGLTVLQGDINEEVLDYPDKTFDYVILSQTLQQVYAPALLIHSLLRIGHKGIVSFPNFSHWKVRLQLLFTGYAPMTRQLPYEWYDTPNIRVITLKDFRKFLHAGGFSILK